MLTRMLVTACATLLCAAASAQTASPVGLWKSVDDETGKTKALIRISEGGGELRGKIEKLFRDPGEEPNPVCDKCDGPRKDQPIVGMTIINGMKPDGAEFSGGQILDPSNGKVYKSRMSLSEDGKKLNVRGYIGMPTFGRTQTWVRAE
ncbi:Uncharacterized conserved protein, DUF2147 family [Noviherbaspirillum humi]|uniref:Uncharacterized conserved protein, DUF2147 family n=1 Tax=Noviherbaspirillum humi TaxID=1688639 RepID=A0A239L8Y1_9BURK|nr:DUF2147 domain-containing protein [Noviherbaspirillum humi]SNT26303.1 Uncharacterized conserved protein, DUF2147 family [Noviherbaspirillum humi]